MTPARAVKSRREEGPAKQRIDCDTESPSVRTAKASLTGPCHYFRPREDHHEVFTSKPWRLSRATKLFA
jgi:hypothetical protein